MALAVLLMIVIAGALAWYQATLDDRIAGRVEPSVAEKLRVKAVAEARRVKAEQDKVFRDRVNASRAGCARSKQGSIDEARQNAIDAAGNQAVADDPAQPLRTQQIRSWQAAEERQLARSARARIIVCELAYPFPGEGKAREVPDRAAIEMTRVEPPRALR